ncbi:MAG TPA: aspartate aminotransferase family protein [Chloroflexota bacterium]|nr:aspartate aminotransferase family protein [Chloroflexota bacterium]
MSKILETFEAMHAGSRTLAARAGRVFPSGVTHDARAFAPWPIYVERARGGRKWDVDGNEYVDFWSGHGALILGHNHPAITAAVAEQVQKGTHFGACHELEVRWGELVQQIVPSASKVKFVSSGTEATMMALRLARAYSGREKIVKIEGNFHGWHDYATVGMEAPYDVPNSRGVPKAVADTIISVPSRDIGAIREALAGDDVAAVIVLCNDVGADYLQQLRGLTRDRGVILIFDEVVTGFRYAPGGAQEYFGVTPDMTTLAKILAGGYSGGAVAARADLLDLFSVRDDVQHMRFGRVPHPGTFNANPVSAAAGIACLEIVRDPAIQQKATATARKLSGVAAEILARRGVEGQTGGESSIVKIAIRGAKVGSRKFNLLTRAALQLGGVDIPRLDSIIVSAVHTDGDIDRFGSAFDQALERLQRDDFL